MRTPVSLSDRSIRDAKAYMANPDASHAIEALIDSYGNLVSDLRRLRRDLIDLERDSAALDLLEQKLRVIARQILDL